MEQKKKEQKVAQILYITIIMALLIMAVVVGVVSTASRQKRPGEHEGTNSSAPQTSEPVSSANSEINAPATSAPSSSSPAAVSSDPATSAPVTSAAATSSASSSAPAQATDAAQQAEAPVKGLPEFIMPTIGNVSKIFSADTLVYSNTMEDYRAHTGIDICATLGEGVMAAAEGVVREVREDPMMGYTVVLSHDGNAETIYQNLSETISVKEGDFVASGTIIGAIGESAMIEIAEEPHLHFEMMVNGEYVNPLDYIAAATMTVVYDE